MTKRTPDQERALATNNPAIVSPGEQLALMPELEIVPVHPSARSLAAALLAMLGRGEALTHPEFMERTGSWRLAAVAFQLGVLGWSIGVEKIHAQSADRPAREIGRYRLLSHHAHALSRGGE
jgi:hypothetical protein